MAWQQAIIWTSTHFTDVYIHLQASMGQPRRYHAQNILVNNVNIIPLHALAPSVASSSTGMALTYISQVEGWYQII